MSVSLEQRIYDQTVASGVLTDRLGAEIAKHAAAADHAREIAPTVIDNLVDNGWIADHERVKVASILGEHGKTLELLAELVTRQPVAKQAMGSPLAAPPALAPSSSYLDVKSAAKSAADLAFERRLDGFAADF